MTGANGFIASKLIGNLIQKKVNVLALDLMAQIDARNLADYRDNKFFEYFCCDIRDSEKLLLLKKKPIIKIFHLASVVGVRYYMHDPLKLIDVIINGTKNIIEFAAFINSKIIFTSTSELYGFNTKLPWSENDDRVIGPPSVDRWSYSSSKAVCEHMLFAQHRKTGLEFTTARFFNVYGPRQAPIYVVSQSIHRALNGQSPFIYDGGSQTRCFTFIDDAVDGLLSIGEHVDCVGQAYNIGNPKEYKISYVVEKICTLSETGLKAKNVNTKQKYGVLYQDIYRRIPDVNKIRNHTGWEAKTSLVAGLEKTIKWALCSENWLDIKVKELQ